MPGSKLPLFPYNREWENQPNSRGLYTHIRIPLKGGMTIPNIATFDHVTHNSIKFGVRKKTTHFLRPFKRVLSPRVSCVELCVGKKRDGSRGVKKRLEIQLGA